jgi:GxxExxY protein
MELQGKDVTEAIIGASFEVYKVLGYGFLEKVYQRAMQLELQSRGFKAELEGEIRVLYKGMEVGLYKADLFVNDRVIVELKVAKSFLSDDEPQLLNELKATGVKVGLLINFGRTKVEFKRMVFWLILIFRLSVFHPCSIRG